MSEISPRQFTIDPTTADTIDSLLQSEFSLKLSDAKKIADCVLKLSDFYIRMPGAQTPWHEQWCQIAYLSYYFPLNEIRSRAVINEGHRFHFFDHITSLIDFGAGLGSASINLNFIPQKTFIESSPLAQKLHEKLLQALHPKTKSWWFSEIQQASKNTLGIFSYSLTEREWLPLWAYDCEALMILEPSTREDGRRLLQIRDDLLSKGFSIWAPCTHQGKCPLLTQSVSDWCHDRVHFDQPAWFELIEEHLPMKNKTLTTSYLLASRKPSPANKSTARITGDLLEEKGKSRQLVCRDENREFLCWMDRNWKQGPQVIPRGTLIKWPEQFETKSNEIRMKSPIQTV